MMKSYVLGSTLIALVLVGCSVIATPTLTQVPAPLERYQVRSWSGEARMATESFTIPSDEWIIEWAADGYFKIDVRNADGSLHKFGAVGTNQGGQSSTVMRGAGKYYLEISPGPYRITVYAFR